MNATPEMTMTALKMVLSLGLVLGVIWGLYRFTRRSLNTGMVGSNANLIRIMASRYLGVKKSITMVQIPGAVLVLGISADKVSLLSKIEDPQLIAGMTAQDPSEPKKGFRDQLQRMLHPMQATMATSSKENEIPGL